MQKRHQRRVGAMRRDQIGAHVVGMAGGVSDAQDAGNLRETPGKTRKRPDGAVLPHAGPGVDVLTKQGQLAHAGLGQNFRLADDAGGRAGGFRAARVGHDAEGAELVAALLNGEESRNSARAGALRPRRGDVVELVLDREFRVDDAAPRLSPPQQIGQAMVILRTDDEIDGFLPTQDFGAFGLRHAAGDRDARVAAGGGALLFQLAQLAQFGEDLFGGALPNMAGVENNQIGVLDAGRLVEAFRRENVGHARGVIDIHLAAEGFDEDLARAAVPGRGVRHVLPRVRIEIETHLPCMVAAIPRPSFSFLRLFGRRENRDKIGSTEIRHARQRAHLFMRDAGHGLAFIGAREDQRGAEMNLAIDRARPQHMPEMGREIAVAIPGDRPDVLIGRAADRRDGCRRWRRAGRSPYRFPHGEPAGRARRRNERRGSA
jgi:hypothetical protein